MQKNKVAGALSIAMALLIASCGERGERKSEMTSILTIGEVNSVMDNSGDSLVAFDMYADWCGPCRILAPTLEKVAAATKGKVAFYRINLDQVPEAGQTFGVGGIPFVVFVKNKKVVATFTGVQPEESYLRAIQRFSGHEEASTPPGAQKM
jgi:thioredoxin 1